MLFDDRFRGYQVGHLKRDMIAGITVGIVAIPLAMAFAMASGVKPEYGLYTTIIAGFLVAVFGGSRFQIAGPTGAFIPVLLAIVLQYGYEDLLIAGFLAGILLIAMSVFRLGSIIKFMPRSVTIGFTSGIAVIIFTGQIVNFLGLEGVEKRQFFHENMMELFRHLPSINGYSLLTAMLGLLLILVVPRLFPRLPVLLIALLIPTMVTLVFYPDKVDTVGSAFGGIPQSMPSFSFPEITWDKVSQLWQPALVIAALGGIESLLSAVVADGMTGKRHRSNRELFGQGLANLITPLFGGIPATGAIARTATNIKSGGVSPLSGILHSVFVLIALLVFAPYASYIPLASMAPILMMVAWNMSEQRTFIRILGLRTGDSLVLLITFMLTVFVNLTVAVEVGLLLAMVSFIKRMGGTMEVEKVLPQGHHQPVSSDPIHQGHNCPQLAIFNVDGPLFFGAADRFVQILTKTYKGSRVLLLRMGHVSVMDATGEGYLASFVAEFQEKGGTILLSGIREQPLQMMKKSGLYDKIGEKHIFDHTGPAIAYGLTLIDYTDCRCCPHDAFAECQSFKIGDVAVKA